MRGYAGQSIWDWWKLPGYVDPRYTDYARANASIGVNGAVLNNVDANAQILTAPFIAKVAAVAGALRPYGIRVYLSARFSAPLEIGGMSTADPLDADVRAWWAAKADEIVQVTECLGVNGRVAAVRRPDFPNVLVKAKQCHVGPVA